jgi:PAS domain S-box-containing protein
MSKILESLTSPAYREGIGAFVVMLTLAVILLRTPRGRRPGQWLVLAGAGLLLLSFALGFAGSAFCLQVSPLLDSSKPIHEDVVGFLRYILGLPLLLLGAVLESTRYPLCITGGASLPKALKGGLSATAHDVTQLRKSLQRKKRELETLRERLTGGSGEESEASDKLKETLSLLLLSEEKLRILSESSADGFLVADLEKREIEEVNECLARLVGRDPASLRGKPLADAVGRTVASLDARLIREMSQDRLPYETSLVGDGGKQIPMVLGFSVVEVGDRSLLLVVARNVAEQEGLRRELEQKNEALEDQGRVLKEANRLISERAEKMRVMNEKLLELQTVKDDFLSSVSHELRTPLTSIRSFSEILLSNEDAEDEVKQEFISIINKESERLTRLINDVLDLAKIEAGKLSIRVADLDLEELTGEVVRSLAPLADERGISLESEIPPDLPPVKADRDKLQQVLTNLLSNAIKFGAEGTPVLIDAQLKSDGMVEVSVSDQGQGIPEEELERVFDKFRQVGDSLTDKPQGSGLGLAICREIIGLHGGRIWARSRPGHGSSFYFTLSIHDLPPEVDEGEPTAALQLPDESPAEEVAAQNEVPAEEKAPMAILLELPDMDDVEDGEPLEEDVAAADGAPLSSGQLPPLRARKPRKLNGGKLPPMPEPRKL